MDVAEQSQWGFLKNIINIDKFFDSGTDASGSGLSEKKAIDKAGTAVAEVQKGSEEPKKVRQGQSLAK